MDINTLNDFFLELSNDEMSLLYSGDFSDEVTSKVIGLSGAQFDDGTDMNKLQRKTGFLIAECFQNIVRHNESSVENGYFLTRNEDGVLHIASGNIIENDMIEPLSDKLDHLNTLSKEELKDVYVMTLRNNKISEKGGAGLGLIEMARKTGNKLYFEFDKINDELSYFYFQLKFQTLKERDEKNSSALSLPKSIELRKKMLDNHIFLIYRGDISMNTIMPIMSMVEKSLASHDVEITTSKKVFIVLIEFLQNMSKHGLSVDGRQDGLLLIGERDGQYLIGGSNYVSNDEKKRLEERLSKYVQMDRDDLNDEYKNILRNGDPDNTKGAGLGLIEISRRSSKQSQYNFQEFNDHVIFNMLLQI